MSARTELPPMSVSLVEVPSIVPSEETPVIVRS
jgi:hypothetical protein